MAKTLSVVGDSGIECVPLAEVRGERTDEQTDALVERWFADHFFGSAVARDTQAWNAAHAAKEALKLLLKGA
jgi:hypothetical protein